MGKTIETLTGEKTIPDNLEPSLEAFTITILQRNEEFRDSDAGQATVNILMGVFGAAGAGKPPEVQKQQFKDSLSGSIINNGLETVRLLENDLRLILTEKELQEVFSPQSKS